MLLSEVYGLIQKTCDSMKLSFQELCDSQKPEYIRLKYCLIFFIWLKGQITEVKLAEIFGYAKLDGSTISYCLKVTSWRISHWSDWRFCYERIEWIWEKIQTTGGTNKFYKNNKKVNFNQEIKNRQLNNQLLMF